MTEKPTVVCAQNAAQARKLMRYDALQAPVVLLCVRPTRTDPAANARFAEEMYRTAQSCGAELALLFSDYPAVAAAQLIHRRGAKQVLVETSSAGVSPFAKTIRRLVPQVQVLEKRQGLPVRPGRRHSLAGSHAESVQADGLTAVMMH